MMNYRPAISVNLLIYSFG